MKVLNVRLISIVVASIFVVTSFPPRCHPWLAWIAFTPALCVALQGGLRNCAICGAIFEFCFFGLQFALTSPSFRVVIPLEQLIPMTCFVLLSVAILGALSFCALYQLVRRCRWSVAIAFPLVWLVRDLLLDVFSRRVVGTTADIFQLAITQTSWPVMIQIADLLGMSGVTWIVTSLNGAIIDGGHLWWSSDRRHHQRCIIGVCFSVLQFAITLTYGGWQLRQMQTLGPQCLVIPQLFGLTGDIDVSQFDQVLSREIALAIWPEDACFNTTIVPGVPESASAIIDRSNEWKLPLLVGTKRLREGDLAGPYNSMVLVAPNSGVTGTYDKMFLTPITECDLPIKVTLLTTFGSFDHSNTLKFVSGTSHQQTLDVLVNGIKVGVGICHDICFREWGWATMNRSPRPDFLVQCANEGIDKTSHGRSLLLACAQLRAVECRRSLIRCVRDGFSAAIDSNGRLLFLVQGDQINQPFVTPRIPLDIRKSPFSSFQQWPILCLMIATIFFGLFAFRIRERDNDAR